MLCRRATSADESMKSSGAVVSRYATHSRALSLFVRSFVRKFRAQSLRLALDFRRASVVAFKPLQFSQQHAHNSEIFVTYRIHQNGRLSLYGGTGACGAGATACGASFASFGLPSNFISFATISVAYLFSPLCSYSRVRILPSI